jgi:ABC-type microcin C transport system permease subunit YejE
MSRTLKYAIPMLLIFALYFFGFNEYTMYTSVQCVVGIVIGIIFCIYSRHLDLKTVKFGIISLGVPLVALGLILVLYLIFDDGDAMFGNLEGAAYCLWYLNMAKINVISLVSYGLLSTILPV